MKIRIRDPSRGCKVENCNGKHNSFGYCRSHYNRLRNTGTLLKRVHKKRKCSIEGCNKKYRSKGYCVKHYERWRKWDDPLYEKPINNCSIESCNNKYHAKGFCDKHYLRFKIHGDPLKVLSVREHSDVCQIEKCDKKYKTNGLCSYHWGMKYHKDHPEVVLKSNKKRLEKLGNTFNIISNEYLYAIQSWAAVGKKRDKYKCQVCGTSGTSKTLHGHHILHKSLYPQLSLNLNNHITLCIKCHEETHGFKTY